MNNNCSMWQKINKKLKKCMKRWWKLMIKLVDIQIQNLNNLIKQSRKTFIINKNKD